MNIILPYIMKKPMCYKCDKEFSSKQMRDYHCRNNVCTKELGPGISNILDKIYECRFCRKKFTSNQSLQYHQNNLVCIEKNKTCKFCNKTLSSLRNFRQHRDKCKIRKAEIDKFREYNHLIHHTAVEHLLEERRDLRWQMKDFDKEEPWHNQKYWMGTCDRCGCVRKAAGHYASCHSLI